MESHHTNIKWIIYASMFDIDNVNPRKEISHGDNVESWSFVQRLTLSIALSLPFTIHYIIPNRLSSRLYIPYPEVAVNCFGIVIWSTKSSFFLYHVEYLVWQVILWTVYTNFVKSRIRALVTVRNYTRIQNITFKRYTIRPKDKCQQEECSYFENLRNISLYKRSCSTHLLFS